MFQLGIGPIAHSARLHVHSAGSFHIIVLLAESTRDPRVEYLRVQIVEEELDVAVEADGIAGQIEEVEK